MYSFVTELGMNFTQQQNDLTDPEGHLTTLNPRAPKNEDPFISGHKVQIKKKTWYKSPKKQKHVRY